MPVASGTRHDTAFLMRLMAWSKPLQIDSRNAVLFFCHQNVQIVIIFYYLCQDSWSFIYFLSHRSGK